MSITTARPTPRSKCASALRKPRRASSSPVEHAHLACRSRRLHAVEEAAAVGRLAHGARRHGFDARGAELPGQRRHAVAGLRARGAWIVAQACRCCRRPAPSRGAAFISSTTRMPPSGDDVGDDLPDGVGADVDGGRGGSVAVGRRFGHLRGARSRTRDGRGAVDSASERRQPSRLGRDLTFGCAPRCSHLRSDA